MYQEEIMKKSNKIISIKVHQAKRKMKAKEKSKDKSKANKFKRIII